MKKKRFKMKIDGVPQKIRGRSLNPTAGVIRYIELIDKWKIFNKTARQDNKVQLSFKDWLEHEEIDLEEYVQKDLKSDFIHLRNSKYMNNKPIQRGIRIKRKNSNLKPRVDHEQDLHFLGLEEYYKRTIGIVPFPTS